jgi:general secretion pathway protein G
MPQAMTRFNKTGFTLVELVIVIVVLGIIASIAVARISDFVHESRVAATKSEMLEIKKAIVGDPQPIATGQHVSAGFLGDCGFLPERLEDLVTRPDSIPVYDRIERLGWNGPYIDSSAGAYLTDAWKVPYTYDPVARTLVSHGSPETITITL